jgi:hypothetical protein
MALTSKEVEQITVDTLLNRTQRVTGKDAEEFQRKLKKDILLAKEKGWHIEMPFEIPEIQ